MDVLSSVCIIRLAGAEHGAATPHYDALQKRLAEEKALSYRLSSTWMPKQKAEDKKWASQLKPLWGLEHNPKADVVMSLGFGYNV